MATYRSGESDTSSGNGASYRLSGLVGPGNSAFNGLGDALGLQNVAYEELGCRTQCLGKCLAVLFILIQDGDMTAVGDNVFTAGAAQAGCTIAGR